MTILGTFETVYSYNLAQMTSDGELLRFKQSISYPIALVTLAALTPPDVEIEINNESVEDIDLDADVDLVGISGYTAQISSGYRLADEFRKRGVPVVMGGIHVSLNPDEAQEHADAIIIGEAEGLWEQVVRDAQAGMLKNRYLCSTYSDMAHPVIPRYDLVERQHYINPPTVKSNLIPIQTARGCPYNCDFCLSGPFSGTALSHEADLCGAARKSKRADLIISFFLMTISSAIR